MIAMGKKLDIVYFRTLQDTCTTPLYFTPDSTNSIADPMVNNYCLLIFNISIQTFFKTRSRPSQIPVENEPMSRNYDYQGQFVSDIIQHDRNIRQKMFKIEADDISHGFKIDEALVFAKNDP